MTRPSATAKATVQAKPHRIPKSGALPHYECHKHALAAHKIARGGVIAYATESVWGLGCDPFNESAIQRVLSLKQRPREKGLILLSGQTEHYASLLSHLSEDARERFYQACDRPTTWLVPDPDNQVSPWVKGDHEFVAVRVSSSPSVSRLTAVLGHPIISTSANPAGRPTASDVLQLRRYFGDQLDYILPGKVSPGAQASRIINIETGAIIRP